MSSNSINSNLLSQIASSPTSSKQFANDLNQISSDLQSGNLASAQSDYVTLSTDMLNGANANAPASTSTAGNFTSSVVSNVAGSATGSSQFAGELNMLGFDLGNNDLTSAQGDMLAMTSTALGATAAATSNASPTETTTATSSTHAGSPLSADMQTDIRAIVEAMQSGVTSAASSAMAQLASDAQNSAGSSYLKTLATSADNGSGSTDSTSSNVTALLKSLESNTSTVNALLESSLNTDV